MKKNLGSDSSSEKASVNSSESVQELTQTQMQDSTLAHHNLPNLPSPRALSDSSPSSYPRISILILLVFFSAQMWAAGSYYWGDYPWDERFSWRMFSSVRSLSCQVQMWESSEQGQLCPDGQTAHCTQVRLSSRYHMVWVNLLKRGRRQVLKEIDKS